MSTTETGAGTPTNTPSADLAQFSELWAKPGVRAALEQLREVVGNEVLDAAMAYYAELAERVERARRAVEPFRRYNAGTGARWQHVAFSPDGSRRIFADEWRELLDAVGALAPSPSPSPVEPRTEGESREAELERIVRRLSRSFECYTAQHKPESEWDEYDHSILPVWREALAMVKP